MAPTCRMESTCAEGKQHYMDLGAAAARHTSDFGLLQKAQKPLSPQLVYSKSDKIFEQCEEFLSYLNKFPGPELLCSKGELHWQGSSCLGQLRHCRLSTALEHGLHLIEPHLKKKVPGESCLSHEPLLPAQCCFYPCCWEQGRR